MKLTETQELLKEISAVDKRQITQETVQMWFNILSHIPLDIAKEAHLLARRDSSVTYLEPKHIVAWAKEAAYRLDRAKPHEEQEIKQSSPEPTCKAHNKKLLSCSVCCRRMSEMEHLHDAALLVWAKENIYA